MKAHWQYFLYVIRHKYFVFKHCMIMGVPLWRALVHDWTKFTLAEWGPYVDFFYRGEPSSKSSSGQVRKVASIEFEHAWNHHQKLNPHHWQYWVLIPDEDGGGGLEIPETYVREMLADWAGAGEAITGKVDPAGWYRKNGSKMILHDKTRVMVEAMLARYF